METETANNSATRKIHDFYYDFMGFGRCPSRCRITVWEKDNANLVLFTDIGIGTTVTRFSEHLAEHVKPYLTRPSIRYFETYQYKIDAGENRAYNEIFYEQSEGAVLANWDTISNSEFEKLIK